MADTLTDAERAENVADACIGRPVVSIELEPIYALMMLSLIQLAAKHPEITPGSAKFARDLIAAVASQLPPAAQEILTLGWSADSPLVRATVIDGD